MPSSRKSATIDEYHGTAVSEDYRWLENWDADEVKNWTQAQNTYARSHLDSLPTNKALRQRLVAAMIFPGLCSPALAASVALQAPADDEPGYQTSNHTPAEQCLPLENACAVDDPNDKPCCSANTSSRCSPSSFDAA